MVHLYIGKSRAHIHVHKTILCRRVEYFDTMFNGGLKEENDNSVYFPEDDIESFDLLMEWIYTDTLRPLSIVADDETEKTVSWDPIGLYILAYRLCITKLSNRVMDCYRLLHVESNTRPSRRAISRVYSNAPVGSPIRLYCVQFLGYFILKFQEEEISSTSRMKNNDIYGLLWQNEDLGKDFITLIRGQGGKAPVDPRTLPRCFYHTHEAGESCL